MKYSRKPLVVDIRRVEPVGDEVDNIDEVHAFLFNTPFEAKSFLFKKLKNLLDKKQSISTCIAQTNLKPLSGHRGVSDPKPLSGLRCVSAQLQSSHDRSFSFCKWNLSYNEARYLPMQIQLQSLRDRSFASCKRNFGYNGASYLPLQVQLQSSRDRSFASCKRYFSYNRADLDPTRAFDVSTLGSMLQCYACIYA
jgi:hypothetical protein